MRSVEASWPAWARACPRVESGRSIQVPRRVWLIRYCAARCLTALNRPEASPWPRWEGANARQLYHAARFRVVYSGRQEALEASEGCLARLEGDRCRQYLSVTIVQVTRYHYVLTKALGIPPACKASSPSGNGYDIYDLYDLGEFDQKGSVGSKWGTKKELVELCNKANEVGVGIYFDAVLNHKGRSA
jgi:hypothetical protein